MPGEFILELEHVGVLEIEDLDQIKIRMGTHPPRGKEGGGGGSSTTDTPFFPIELPVLRGWGGGRGGGGGSSSRLTDDHVFDVGP